MHMVVMFVCQDIPDLKSDLIIIVILLFVSYSARNYEGGYKEWSEKEGKWFLLIEVYIEQYTYNVYNH